MISQPCFQVSLVLGYSFIDDLLGDLQDKSLLEREMVPFLLLPMTCF